MEVTRTNYNDTNYKETDDDDKEGSCGKSSAVWSLICVAVFLVFAGLVATYQLKNTTSGFWNGWQTIKGSVQTSSIVVAIVGSIVCLASTLYLVNRYQALYEEYGDKDYNYFPIVVSYVGTAIGGFLLCIGLSLFIGWIGLADTVIRGTLRPGALTRTFGELGSDILRSTVFGGALPEEICKFLAFVIVFYLFSMKPDNDFRVRVMIAVATAAGMGFGVIEGVWYVSVCDFTQEVWSAIIIVGIRAVVAIPSHAMMGYIQGCNYLISYLNGDGCFIRFLLTTWMSILLHAAWNTWAALMGSKGTGLMKYLFFLVFSLAGDLALLYFVCQWRFHTLKDMFRELHGGDVEEGAGELEGREAVWRIVRPASGGEYYWNSSTGQTQWDRPSSFPYEETSVGEIEGYQGPTK